ncbi:homospermidine synthase [Ramlibacter tataouinensis]|uniref:Homospermidine synthase n=1 Tax=Ramlibacter tataouinensis TaxID=94132 RepID=A0A127JYZ8_9BURK|nr:homospermidine synthase [Ramlibacter tataouinensis]
MRHATFPGRIVMVGFGCVGQGVLPVLEPALGVARGRTTIVTPGAECPHVAARLGAELIVTALTPGNFEQVLSPLLHEGDFLLNLSVHVSSLALIEFCRRRGALYLDTCCEPWLGRYDNPRLSASERSNYALREEVLAWSRDHPRGPTALLTQGANPGLVSSFVKQALLQMASDLGLALPRPQVPQDWPRLAQALDVKVIHIAERDTQTTSRRKLRDEFVNTWSVDGFVDEGLQPSELGWGTHERHWPADAGRHGHGCGAAIYLERPGVATRVRSWTPLEGSYHGFLVTHAESISIADYFTLREGGRVAYRPTVNYAYHPCDDTVLSLHELAGRNGQLQQRHRILRDEIDSGTDELGVLLMGNERGVYWYGSRLSIGRARELAPYNSATSLQVVAGVLGGMVWALRHPRCGVVEPEELDHDTVLEVAAPWLGELAGVWGDWTPLRGRSELYPEETDPADPWQFLNFRVK